MKKVNPTGMVNAESADIDYSEWYLKCHTPHPIKKVTSMAVVFVLEMTSGAPFYTFPMILHCPECGGRHIDEGEFLTKPHHTHACQHCGFVWRPALVNTHGVQFLPGFTNEPFDQPIRVETDQ